MVASADEEGDIAMRCDAIAQTERVVVYILTDGSRTVHQLLLDPSRANLNSGGT